jgi:hypothetical protein
MNTTPKPWYKKKRYYVLTGLIALLSMASIGSGQSNSTSYVQGVNYTSEPTAVKVDQVPVSEVKQVQVPVPVSIPTPALVNVDNGLSNNNHYTNTEGNTVHSPAYNTEDSSVPSGASAQCRDGSYSFSQSRRGTCSHHGGVSTWF